MYYKVMGVLALAVIGGSVMAQTARTRPTNFQINEILVNPSGSGDDNSGREFIEIYGPASTSLNGYTVVVLENEEDGSPNNDRGTVKNLFKIPNGKSTDANGVFVIRDQTNAGGLATFNPTDPLVGSANEWSVQFQTTGAQGDGNTLENEGGNYFLVTGVNSNLVQKEESGGTTLVQGTDLDTNDDGALDYYADGDNDRIINGLESSPSGVKLADNIVDFVFLGDSSWDDNADEQGFASDVKEKNCNYILSLLPGGSSPADDYVQGYVIVDLHIGVDNDAAATWTADLVARVGDYDALVCDVTANSNAQDFDSSEKSFSHTYINRTSGTVPWDNVVGTLRATPGRVGQYSVRDKNGINWTH